MCDPQFTTKSNLLFDLEIIQTKLSDVEIESPKVYKAIKPLADHLIQHLRKIIIWIDERKDEGEKKNVIPSELNQFDEFWKEVNQNSNYPQTAYVVARKAWLKAKGLQSFN